MYASRFLNRVEHNYNTTHKEVLTMVFSLHKFRHDLLGNKLVFYVDHMALVYLVNKPQVSGKITRWFLLFFKYDFTVVYKPCKTHVITNALSRLLDSTEPTSVPDQTKCASLFYTRFEWLNDVEEFLKIGQIKGTLSMQQKQILVRRVEPFILKNGELYKTGQGNKL
jgi:hypothetical protein